MPILDFLATSPSAFLITCGLLGLTIGSFLNVVILRLPVMMENEWKAQCAELADGEAMAPTTPFNLIKPDSRCPQCGHAIRAWENIPLISYLLLRGRCANCQTAISLRYPTVELVTGLLSVIVAWHFGWSWQAGAALLLTWALIALSVIDFDHQLLPDKITLPMLWLGLLLSLTGLFTDPQASIIGAVVGYLSLWIIFHLFRLLTGKEGMGYGDFKLFALFGAWLGWQSLLLILLLSSLVGAIVGITLIVARGRDRQLPIPFGPYLAAAGWIALLWGNPIIDSYLRYSHISP